MAVFITGDTHGRIGLSKLFGMNFDACGLTKDDFLIILGDFGLVWGSSGALHDIYEETLDWLDSKPWTTLFIDGNHDNHDLLASYPVSTWHGGKVHFIRDSVIHLMRGEMFDIDGKLFFAMGGARSIDRARRVEGDSWWEAEVPDGDERQHAIDTLESYGWSCDYVLTHDCPVNVMFDIGYRTSKTFEADRYEQWLQYIADNLDFEHWFFGHYHDDLLNVGIGGKYTLLFDNIIELSDGYWSERMSQVKVVDSSQLPDPVNEHGYTLAEIADIAGVTDEEAEDAFFAHMAGSTVMGDGNGNVIVYRCDVMRVLEWL